MANSDKNIVITPNIGNTAEPTIVFTGANNAPVTLRVLDDGTISFEGGSGQLFSISNNMSGQIFSVNDISGLPSLEVYSNGQINLAPFGGNIALGSVTSTVTLSGNLIANAPFAVVNTTANVLYISANGNVGIGNATPAYPLHIDDNGSNGRGVLITGGGSGGNILTIQRDVGAAGSVTIGASDGAPKIAFVGTSNSMMIGTIANGNTLRLARDYTSSNAGLSVSLTNNIGINNTVPTHTLSVNGDALIQSSLNVSTTFASGNATITGFANVVGNAQVTDTLTGNNVVITGNLTVSGTTTYINTTNMNVGDNIITLNADLGAVSPTENAGIEVNRGTSPNTSLYWDETIKGWIASAGNDANGDFRITTNTYVSGTSMSAGGLSTYWGNTSVPSAYASFAIGSGVNKFRTQSRDYLIANTASDLMIVAANGNIGLGNTTPVHKVSVGGTLHIGGTVNATANVQFVGGASFGGVSDVVPLANVRVLVDGGSTSGLLVNRQSTYLLTGNTIGTAAAKFIVSPYSSSTNGHIAVGSVHSNTSNGTVAIESRHYLTSNSSGSYQAGFAIVNDTNNDGIADYNVRVMEWEMYSAGSTTFFSNNVARAYIAANGNIGIGNNTPSCPLEVNGRVRAVGNGTVGAFTAITGSTPASITILPGASDGAYNSLVVAGDSLIYCSNGAQNNGNLVIGTWTSYSGGYGIKLVGNTYHTQIQGNTFAVSNGTANTIVCYANGTVAIGNTSALPVVQFQVVTTATAGAGNPIATFGTASDRSRIRILDENGTGQIPPTISCNSAAYGLGLAADQGSTAPIIFYAGGTANTTNEKMRICGNGNIGIATTTPGSKLVINGETLSGSFRTGNSIVNGAISATLSSTTQTSIDTTSQTSTKSLKYMVEVTRGSEYQVSEMLVVANSSLAILTEYAIVHTSALPLVSYDADVSGGNIRLLATSSNSTSTSIKLLKTAFV